MNRLIFPLLISIIALIVVSVAKIDVSVEQPSEPDIQAVSTLSSLILSITKNSIKATQLAAFSTPAPVMGTVNGKICYPGEHVPAMTVYLRNNISSQLFELPTLENQTSYSMQLPPGDYYAYAWVPLYQVGGLYSRAVVCGLKAGCEDHSPQSFTIAAGSTREGIDICDWVIPPDKLPLDNGTVLP